MAIRHSIVFFLGLGAWNLGLGTSLLSAQTNITGSFVYKSISRNYIIHLPPSPGPNLPMVFNLHGYGQTAALHQLYTKFDDVADTAGFIVVYPNAVNGVWDTVFINSPIDDVGFLSALIDTVSSQYNIDLFKVFSTGLSMGGYMTYRLACELPGKIAAVASVAGPVVQPILGACNSTAPISVMHIHGTADATVPYNGLDYWPAIDTLIQYFVTKNNCPVQPDSTVIPDINTSDSCNVVKYHYGYCDDSTEVVFYKIFNGGHTWPGALPWQPLGNTNQDIKAGVEIWNFFKKHRIDNTTIGINQYSIINNQLSVYPNPFSGKINVQINTSRVKCLTIFNLLGEKVARSAIPVRQLAERNLTIDLSNQPNGIYFLRVEKQDGSFSFFKIIKQFNNLTI